MRILGFDPGYARMGWGAISSLEGFGIEKAKTIGYGTIETPPLHPPSQRMATLYKESSLLMENVRADVVVMERLYFSKNHRTAAGVFQAQGVILAAAGQRNCFCTELAPTTVKLTVTGFGHANKGQVMTMVCRLLNLVPPIQPDDASDGLATAIAGLIHFKSLARLQNISSATQNKKG